VRLESVTVNFLEVQSVKHPWGGDTYTISYTIQDVRVTPPFISPQAHLFLKVGFCETCKSNDCVHNNVIKAADEVLDHYEQVRENVFKVKLPEVKGVIKK
jgi:hypothetical protein